MLTKVSTILSLLSVLLLKKCNVLHWSVDVLLMRDLGLSTRFHSAGAF